MVFLRNKRLSVLFLFLAVFTQQSAHAGLADWFNNQSFALFKQKTEPYLKDPKTYLAVAIAATGAYFLGREVYWGFKSELPYHRAIEYMRRGFSSVIQNSEDVKTIMFKAIEHLTGEQTTPEEVMFEKRALDVVINYYRTNYEFYRQADQAFRNALLEVGGIEILDRSNLVQNQAGATCAMHAAFNGTALFNCFTNLVGNVLDVLMEGPNITQWKSSLADQVDAEHYNDDHENLDDFAIDHVMQGLLDMDQQNYTIISNTMEFGPEQDERFSDVVRRLQSQNNTCHVFLLGSMRNYQSEMGHLRGSMGHWIAVIARREGDRIRLYVMDSLCDNNTEPGLVERLASLLNIPYQELQLIRSIEEDFETAYTLCYGDSEGQNANLVNCIDRIQTIVTKAQGLLHSATFQTKYRPGLESMLKNILGGSVGEKTKSMANGLLAALALNGPLSLSGASSSSSSRVDDGSINW